MASASDSGISALDSAWDAPEQPAPRPSPMALVDSSWSEPHGVAVVGRPEAAPFPVVSVPLAAGTRPLRTATADPDEGELDPAPPLVPAPPILPAGPRFFDMPVGRQAGARSCATSRPELGHDATSIVMPLPLPPAPDRNDLSRAVVITSEHASRLRDQKKAAKVARRRGRLLLLACPLVGVALGFLALALWPKPEGRRAAPQQQVAAPAPDSTSAPVAAPVAAPVTTPAAPKAAAKASKPARKIAAPQLATSKPAAESVAPKPVARPPVKRVAAAAPKAPAPAAPKAAAKPGKPTQKIAARAAPAAKQPPAKQPSAKKPAGATRPGARIAARAAPAAKASAKPGKPASKPGKPAAAAKKPAPAKKRAR